MLRSLALCATFMAPVPALAQVASPCGWQTSAQAIVEPWEDNTRTFANGAVRLAVLDTIEPAAAAAYLLILSPPFAELGERQCRMVGLTAEYGFAGLAFGALTSDYDPATGLIFRLAVSVPGGDGLVPRDLIVTLNQATGAVDARFAEVAQ